MNCPEIRLTDTKTLYNSVQTLPLIVVDSSCCYAVISLQGAQILEFKAKNKKPLLWLSPKVIFEQGKAIRGGIPICAPWFGPYKQPKKPQTSYPNHGFARTALWQCDFHRVIDNDVVIRLSLEPNQHTLDLYPYQFAMAIEFTLAKELTIAFQVHNNSEQLMPFEWALHSYFHIADLSQVEVSNLHGYEYVDSADQQRQDTLSGNLYFQGEVDRYFINASEQQSIIQPHPITISGTDCDSVITWNPGEKLAQAMPDIGIENYQDFICVERGAIFDNQWQLAPWEQRSASLTLSN